MITLSRLVHFISNAPTFFVLATKPTMNQHHTTDARSSTRHIDEGNLDVIDLKNEIDSLNNLLAESAMALNNLNEKVGLYVHERT